MSAVKSLAELQAEAQPLLKRYGVNKMFATSDGQFFLIHSRAALHAGSIHTIYPVGLEVDANETDTDKPDPLSVKAIAELISEEKDLGLLHSMLLDEIAGQNRKTATAAIEKRIGILTDLRAKEDLPNE